MRKIAMVIGILSVLATSANAFIWNTSDNLNTYNFYSSTDYTLNTLEIFYE